MKEFKSRESKPLSTFKVTGAPKAGLVVLSLQERTGDPDRSTSSGVYTAGLFPQDEAPYMAGALLEESGTGAEALPEELFQKVLHLLDNATSENLFSLARTALNVGVVKRAKERATAAQQTRRVELAQLLRRGGVDGKLRPWDELADYNKELWLAKADVALSYTNNDK